MLPSAHPAFPAGSHAVKLATPRGCGTDWAESLVTIPEDSSSEPVSAGRESFLYVLDGDVDVVADGLLDRLGVAGSFAYVPPRPGGFTIRSSGGARFLWLERPYRDLDGHVAPASYSGMRDDIAIVEDSLVRGAYERLLLPIDDLAFDFAMNLLAFDPGVAFHQVEIHDEDHGIFFTAGEAIYLLGESLYHVRAGDFMYLAPYCPQHMVAIGSERAEYLLYKPINRDSFAL